MKDRKTDVMCKHSELQYKEVIEATTSIEIVEHDELGRVLECNNEYGHRIRQGVYCLECDKYWSINKKVPKFVTKFVEEIDKLRQK